MEEKKMVSRARAVPRNIDRPNRTAEHLVVFLFFYYGVMFLLHDPMPAFGAGFFSVYVMQKLTVDKPEGQVYRLIYRIKWIQFGKMLPNPAKVKKFEI